MKFAFIQQHESECQGKIMCQVLRVSPSGYYAWRGRAKRSREQANTQLSRHIQKAQRDSRGPDGSTRIVPAWRAKGIVGTHKRVARLRPGLGLAGISPRRKTATTTVSNPKLPIAPKLLNRDFSARAANPKWLAAITYMDTLAGCLYLASLEDVFSRSILGWAMEAPMETALVERALDRARFQRQPAGQRLHHADRGSQFASHDYPGWLERRGMTVRMSRPAHCYDNAMQASF